MATTFAMDCTWCGSRNQTVDVVDAQRSRHSPDYMELETPNGWTVAARCRRCSGYMAVTIILDRDTNPGEDHRKDITSWIATVAAVCPTGQYEVSANWPQNVREAMEDAHEATRARAKCQSFRAAIEFALRSAKLEAKAGEPLGAILKRAEADKAISPALIELCDQIKAFGNWGMHWAETDLEDSDARAAQEITEAILTYLFDMPARVAHAKKRTEAAKAAHQNAG